MPSALQYPYRIGITGLRSFDSAEQERDAIRAIREALQNVKKDLSHTNNLQQENFYLSGITALAEGADRIFAEEVIALGGKLEVILPFKPIEALYEFKENGSWKRFEGLLKGDACPVIISHSDRPHKEWCYKKAGTLMVEQCDLLIAIYKDSEPKGPAGTVNILAYARELEKRCIVIRGVPPAGSNPLYWETEPEKIEEIIAPGYPEFETLKKELESTAGTAYQQFHNTKPDDHDYKLYTTHFDMIAKAHTYWDNLATTARKDNERKFKIIYRLAAFASLIGTVAICVAVAEHLKPENNIGHTEIITHVIELLALISGVVIYLWHGKKQNHLKWIRYRLLAEKKRLELFKLACKSNCAETFNHGQIALTKKLSKNNATVKKNITITLAHERLAVAVTQNFKLKTLKPLDINTRKDVLLKGLIENQLKYHAHTEENYEHRNKKTKYKNIAMVTLAIFLLSFLCVAALCPALEECAKFINIKWFMLGTLVLIPVIAAVIEGDNKMLDYEKAEKASARMKALFTEYKIWLTDYWETTPHAAPKTSAEKETELAFIMDQVEHLMLSENTEWKLLPTPLELKV